MTVQYIDINTYTEISDILEDELPSVINEFLKDSSMKISDLECLVKSFEPEKVFAISHSLKSSSANLGALQMSELCREIEAISRNGSMDNVPELFDSLKTIFSASSEELKKLSSGRI